jgi:hypothetical protein
VGRANDLSEDEAHQQAANLNLMFSQYGQRNEADRVEVQPPIEVEVATWSAAGTLDYWVKEERDWWGRVRGPDGRQVWMSFRPPPIECLQSVSGSLGFRHSFISENQYLHLDC